MIWLATDTSSSLGSLAVFSGEKLLGFREWSREGSHSEFITVSCAELFAETGITWNDVKRLAVGTGPGSFTGIRVAVNFVRTAAYVCGLPVYAADSLRLAALPVLQLESRVQVAQYAFRDLIYAAEFEKRDGKIKIVCPPKVLTKVEWLSSLKSGPAFTGSARDVFSGDLPQDLLSKFRPTSGPHARHTNLVPVSTLPESELLSWNQVVPLYIRASEAEEKLSRGLLKPL